MKLRQELKNYTDRKSMGNKKNVFLLHGNHGFFRQKAKEKLITSLKESNTTDISTFELGAVLQKEVKNRLEQKLSSSSLFSSPEIVVLKFSRNSTSNKGKKILEAWGKFIISHLENLPPDIFLIIDSFFKIPKSTPLYKKIEKQPGSAVKLFELKKKEGRTKLNQFVQEYLRREGIKINSQVLERMTGAGREDWWYTFTALEQASTYLRGKNKEQDDEAIENLWDEDKEKNIFWLLDYLGKGEKIRALNLLYEILQGDKSPKETEAAIGLTTLMGRHMRQLLAVKENISSKEAYKEWQVPYFKFNEMKYQADNFSLSFLKSALWKLSEIQEQIKSGLYSPLSIVSFFAFYFMSHHRRS